MIDVPMDLLLAPEVTAQAGCDAARAARYRRRHTSRARRRVRKFATRRATFFPERGREGRNPCRVEGCARWHPRRGFHRRRLCAAWQRPEVSCQSASWPSEPELAGHPLSQLFTGTVNGYIVTSEGRPPVSHLRPGKVRSGGKAWVTIPRTTHHDGTYHARQILPRCLSLSRLSD